MRAAIYSRKSVYTGKGESIENQIEMCRGYIASRLPQIQETAVFEDEGFSGKNTERPQFKRMLREVRAGRFQYVVCYRLDRISRSVGDFASLIEEFRELQVSLVCISENFDTSTPMGKAMLYIASVFAQLERETLAERVRDNMFMLAREGRWLGGTPPTGFLAEKTEKLQIDGRKRTFCLLKESPGEMETVRAAYRIFLETHAISGTCKRLAEEGFLSRKGTCFSPIGMKQLLENPVYCTADSAARAYFLAQGSQVCFGEADCEKGLGLIAYNKRDYRRRGSPRQERAAWIVAQGRHKGVISGEQWTAVQRILSGNRGQAPRARNPYALLSGVLRCGCGRQMFARMRHTEGDVYDYICSGKLRGGAGVCGRPNLNGPQTDGRVCEYLLSRQKERTALAAVLEKMQKSLREEEKSDPLTAIGCRLQRCEEELARLAESLRRKDMEEALFAAVNEAAARLSGERERLLAEKRRLEDLPTSSGADGLSDLKSAFPMMTAPEKRELVRLLVQKIVWDGQDLHLFLYGTPEDAARPAEEKVPPGMAADSPS